MTTENPNVVLPSSKTATTFPAGDLQGVAEELFSKAGYAVPGQTSKNPTGLAGNPRTRSEAKWAIETAMEEAVTYYSSPENLQNLSEELRYLLDRYDVKFGDEDGPVSATTKEALDKKYKETLKDPAAHAVYTNLMVKVYNGSVDRLQKVAKKTGDRSILQMGELEVDENGKAVPQEVTQIGTVPKLEAAYRDAVKRDRDYMYELVTGEDGQTKVAKKKAPGVRDWAKNTSGGIMEAGSTDEAVGFLMGSSIRALFRLMPGFIGAGFRREVEKSSDIRSETAKVLEQIGELSRNKAEAIQQHTGVEKINGDTQTRTQNRGKGGQVGSNGKNGGEPEVIDGEFVMVEDKNTRSENSSASKALPRGTRGALLLGAGGRERD